MHYAANSDFEEIVLDHIDLRESDFSGSILDNTSFRGCNLTGVSFKSALLFECDLTEAVITGADFSYLDSASNIIIRDSSRCSNFSDKLAVGYLKFNGATTDDVDDYFVYYHHPKFVILEKICEPLTKHKHSQFRGLTQRGEARFDPPFARDLVAYLVNIGWAQIGRNRLVSATAVGRNKLMQLVEHQLLPEELKRFLAERD